MTNKRTDEAVSDFCPKCGLKIANDFEAGSLTGFLFESTRCRCAATMAFADGQMTARLLQLKKAKAGTTFISAMAELPSGDKAIGLAPGAIIGGVYEIIQLIGRGGMGEVYLSRHLALNKKCALKVIPPDQLTEVGWQRFQLEARSVAKLEHINLVKVTDLGIHEDCLPFYAMDFIEGENLAEVLEGHGPMPLQTVLAIFIQVCDALDCAHSRGILHRDLKPANIMLTTGKAGARLAKVLDFGLAKLTDHDRDKQSLTAAGEVFGSPLYMSPEQCSGEEADGRSDIYSLGCTMFECLTGLPPFDGQTAVAIVFSHVHATPPSLESACGPGVFPNSLEQVIAKTLRKNPTQRYQTVGQLKSDLELIAAAKESWPVYKGDKQKISRQVQAAASSEVSANAQAAVSGDLSAEVSVAARRRVRPTDSTGLRTGLTVGLITGLTIGLIAGGGAYAIWLFNEKKVGTASRPGGSALASGQALPGISTTSDPAALANLLAIPDSVVLPESAGKLSPRELVKAGERLAKAAQKDGESMLPARYYTVAIQKDPRLTYAYEHLIGFYWDQSIKMPTTDRPTILKKALAVCDEEMKHLPDYVDGYVCRINIYNSLAMWPEALADAERALEIEPTNSKVHLQHAFALNQMHKFSQAISEFEKYLSSADTSYMFTAAHTYQQLNEDKKAVEFCSKWLKIIGPHDGLLILRADSERRLGMYKEALEDYQAFVKLRPEQGPIRRHEMDDCRKHLDS